MFFPLARTAMKFVSYAFISVAYATNSSWATVSGDDLLILVPSIITKQTRVNSQQEFAINSAVVRFTVNDSQAEIVSRGATSVTIGSRTTYIGTQQKTAVNQDSIIRAFDSQNSANNWINSTLETAVANGRGVSLLSVGSKLYASFTGDGTQGLPSQDFRRASQSAQQSWLRSYGAGGGHKTNVVAKIDPASEALLKAVYITAVLSSGKSNTLLVNNLRINSIGNLEVSAMSFFAPRDITE